MTTRLRSAAHSWWRINLRWLVALPVVLAAAAVGWSSQIVSSGWPYSGNQVESDTANFGDPARLDGFDTIELRDGHFKSLHVDQPVELRLVSFERLNELPAFDASDIDQLPRGTEAWRLIAEIDGPSGHDLSGCQFTLVAADGTEFGTEDPMHQGVPCVPDSSLDGTSPNQVPWTIHHVILASSDADLDELRFGFPGAEYISLDLPRE